MKLLMFTKMLKDIGNLTLEEAGDRVAEMGFDGADLTVRPGGYVLPEEASERLCSAIETLRSRGLIVPLITTSITDPSEGHAEDIFRASSECEVEFIKLGYWQYEGLGKIRSQIERAREQLKGIRELSEEYGVTAALHTHSGLFLTADPAVVIMLLQDHDPEHICAYVDPGHMVAQCGPTGWEMGLDLLSPYIRLVAVKNFWHFREMSEKAGEGRWQRRMLPLRERIVPWPSVFRSLKDIGFDGNASVHSEYEGLTLQELLERTRDDLAYLRDVMMETAQKGGD